MLMKKIFLFLGFVTLFQVASAQELKTYSVYDVNFDSKLSVADVTNLVENAIVKDSDPNETQQMMTAEDIIDTYSTLIQSIKNLSGDIASMKDDIVAIKNKLGISGSGDTSSSEHQYVDLGLNVLWATCNIGAENPEDCGDFYAWGETTPYYQEGYALEQPQCHWLSDKEGGYTLSNYFDSNYDSYNLDGVSTLSSANDAATVNWGSDWHMPSNNDFLELLNDCDWSLGDTKKYYIVRGKKPGFTENYIILPLAGSWSDLDYYNQGGAYWANQVYSDWSGYAFGLRLDEEHHATDGANRNLGRTIRAVKNK